MQIWQATKNGTVGSFHTKLIMKFDTTAVTLSHTKIWLILLINLLLRYDDSCLKI